MTNQEFEKWLKTKYIKAEGTYVIGSTEYIPVEGEDTFDDVREAWTASLKATMKKVVKALENNADSELIQTDMEAELIHEFVENVLKELKKVQEDGE